MTNTGRTHTDTHREIFSLWLSADESGREVLLSFAVCVQAFGEGLLPMIKPYADNNDFQGLREYINTLANSIKK